MLFANAGAYIVEDLGPGDRSVYRLFHDMLAAHLRGEPTSEQRELTAAPVAREERRNRIETAITRALLATVPAAPEGGPDWLTAHPYLTTHLAQHAAAAGTEMLADLTRDVGFLAVADPLTLIPLLPPTDPELREIARIYRRAQPLLGNNPVRMPPISPRLTEPSLARPLVKATGVRAALPHASRNSQQR